MIHSATSAYCRFGSDYLSAGELLDWAAHGIQWVPGRDDLLLETQMLGRAIVAPFRHVGVSGNFSGIREKT